MQRENNKTKEVNILDTDFESVVKARKECLDRLITRLKKDIA